MPTTTNPKTLFQLEGYRGIVTGASSGLGLATSMMLAEAGARVLAFSRTGSPKDNEDTSTLSHEANERITHCKIDLTDHAALENLIAHAAENASLDFLVNNAGITERCLFAESNTETWNQIQAVNVTAASVACRAVYPYLKASTLPGRVVNISSMAAHLGFEGVVPYCASKAALVGFTRGLAVEWAKDGILANSVAPGWFPSGMTRKVMDADRQKKILARMPLHRFGKPQELAAMILFLLSPAASYITGQDFAVDGGALAFGY